MLREKASPAILRHLYALRESCRSTGSRSSASRKGCSIERTRSLVCISRARSKVGEPRRVYVSRAYDVGKTRFPVVSFCCIVGEPGLFAILDGERGTRERSKHCPHSETEFFSRSGIILPLELCRMKCLANIRRRIIPHLSTPWEISRPVGYVVCSVRGQGNVIKYGQ